MRTVAEMFAEMKKIADEESYQFNPVKEELDGILQGLWDNDHRYGYLSCPCRIASGLLADDMDIICPCNYRDADVEEYGSACSVQWEIQNGGARRDRIYIILFIP